MGTVPTALTRDRVAHEVLAFIAIRAISRATRTRKEWSGLIAGFRPDTLSRSVLVGLAPRFASNAARLSELLTVLVDDLGVEGTSLSARLRAASELTRLPEPLRHVLRDLSEVDSIPSLPRDAAPLMTTETAVTYASAGSQGLVSGKTEPDSLSIATALQDWELPGDDVDVYASAVTLFERSMVAFVRQQLQTLYGAAWIRQGCGSLRREWQQRAEKSAHIAVPPDSLIGYAHLGELRELIVGRRNWDAFAKTFPSKEWLSSNFRLVEAVRPSAMHAGDRRIYAAEEPAAFVAMTRIARRYHADTANRIDELYLRAIEADDTEPIVEVSALELAATNFGTLPVTNLVGRDDQLNDLEEFWRDPWDRVATITGHGGVGKTALAIELVHRLLSVVISKGERPNPEMVVFLTAKDNWLPGQNQAPDSQRFRTLRAVYEAVIETCGGDVVDDAPLEELRETALSLLDGTSSLLLLDNLETLDDLENAQVARFLHEIPPPSKVLVTDRVNRGAGKIVRLVGLTEEASVELITSRLSDDGIEIDPRDEPAIRNLAKATGGVPLYLLHLASVIAHGTAPAEASNRLRGQDMLHLLEFSFESTVKVLSKEARAVIVLASRLPRPMRRPDVRAVLMDEYLTDEAISELLRANFIERTSDGKRVAFQVSSPQLREYITAREPELLDEKYREGVFTRAKPASVASAAPNLQLAIQQVRAAARAASGTPVTGWNDASRRVEEGIGALGEQPELLSDLGYYYYRDRRRGDARKMLRRAIELGSDEAATWRTLALVEKFDRRYDEGLRAVDYALTLDPTNKHSLQIFGELLLNQAESHSLMVDTGRRSRQLERALAVLNSALEPEDTASRWRTHNERTRDLRDRAEALLLRFGSAGGTRAGENN